MRIGFDVSQTGAGRSGCGYFAESMIRHLAEIDDGNEYVLYPTFGSHWWDPDWQSGIATVAGPNFQRWEGHQSHQESRRFWDEPTEQFEAHLGDPDIVHANNFFCPKGLHAARLVYTLHDLAFLEYPEFATEANRLACFDGVLRASLLADLIVAVSEHSRHHFLETFPHYPPERAIVMHEASRFASRPIARPEKLSMLAPGEFWLSVGTLEPRKNPVRLFRAYARLKSSAPLTWPLVWAGGNGWLMDDLPHLLKEEGLERDILLLGRVDDESLQWLYQNCFAFVFPSVFEGFGLPVLEALSLGAPVIAANTTSIPEVVGAAGLLVDPLSEDEILAAMMKLDGDKALRQGLSSAGPRQAERFSWTQSARQLLQQYQRTCESAPFAN
ncbi:MAG TPA: glycosyltransferase family 1 protein [Verrucomicrobiae bacterium]|nr:glycosyltransferase family 1 protein [Verrucomicrobiae bacterium]